MKVFLSNFGSTLFYPKQQSKFLKKQKYMILCDGVQHIRNKLLLKKDSECEIPLHREIFRDNKYATTSSDTM